MESFHDFKTRIYQLMKDEEYSEALRYFKQNKIHFTLRELSGDPFLHSNMLKSLRKTGAYAAARNFISIYNISIDVRSDEAVFMAWVLILYDWYKQLNENNRNSDLQLMEISLLMPLFENYESAFASSLYNTIVQRVLKTESKKTKVNWSGIKNFCEKISSNRLSEENYEMQHVKKGVTKNTELASVLEEWYVQYSKALFETGTFDLCIQICEEALTKINKLHYSNDIWFKRRIAQCRAKTNELSAAISGYEELIKRKNDWFLLAELGNLYKEDKQFEKAKAIMQSAMLKFGRLNFKIDLIEQLAAVYAALGETSLAQNHYRLAVYIRQSEGWKIDSELLRYSGIDSPDDINTENQASLLKELQHIWQKSDRRNKYENTKKGRVERIGQPKDAGVDIWIRCDKSVQYYSFIKRSNPLFNKLISGLKVSFEAQAVADRPLDRAIKVVSSD